MLTLVSSLLRRRRPLQTTATAPSSTTPLTLPIPLISPPSTTVYASQEVPSGGTSMIGYSYTDRPWKLVAYDVYRAFQLAWALPYVVWPVPSRQGEPGEDTGVEARAAAPAAPRSAPSSGAMAELACTPQNLWCIAVQTVLVVLQLGFLLVVVPVAAVALPAWAWVAVVGACLALNRVVCGVLLNGGLGGGGLAGLAIWDVLDVCGVRSRPPTLYRSDPACAQARPEHAHEQWVFLNGVAVGRHWMQSNVDRLALTFGRPILGVHNKTNGIVFDVLECLVQRNFAYATQDVRVCYGVLKATLFRAEIRRVVLVLHSQGGIEGGLVLDWLLQELPQDLLGKLEVYTFGNAANHFHNPHRGAGAGDDKKAIGHIEHYAHTTDVVALLGVLHFVTTVPQTRMIPRFVGCVFAHTPATAARGGHQFVQHYLDGMFPLARDAQTGGFTGCAETGNAFMESDAVVGPDGDEQAVVQQAYARSWAGGGCGAVLTLKKKRTRRRNGRTGESAEGAVVATTAMTAAATAAAAVPSVEVHAASPVLARQPSRPRPVKVKDVSRLWQYRNGRSPDDRGATFL